MNPLASRCYGDPDAGTHQGRKANAANATATRRASFLPIPSADSRLQRRTTSAELVHGRLRLGYRRPPAGREVVDGCMHARVAPRGAYLAALVCSGGILAAIVVLLVGLELDPRFARPLGWVSCAAAALAFAVLWPAPSWRWGVWLSAALWSFFGFVFSALWWNGVAEWQPLLDAAAVLGAGCAGATLGARARRSRAV